MGSRLSSLCILFSSILVTMGIFVVTNKPVVIVKQAPTDFKVSMHPSLQGRVLGDSVSRGSEAFSFFNNYTDIVGGFFFDPSKTMAVALPPHAVGSDAQVLVTVAMDTPDIYAMNWRQASDVQKISIDAGKDADSASQLSNASVTFSYNSNELDAIDQSTLAIFYNPEQSKRWIKLDSRIDPKAQTVTAGIVDPNVRLAMFGQPSIR